MQIRAATLESRLQDLIPTLKEIRCITGTPSVAVGVLHEGNVVFTHNDGFRDVGVQSAANIDTKYLIGSLTKGFIAACCGSLVSEGKLHWSDKINSIIDFKTVHDPVIGERATIGDALSHSTGLAQLDLSWYGAYGKSLLAKTDLLHAANNLPIAEDFRGKWHYNNYMYGLVASIIERIDGANWGQSVRKRLFEPLRMWNSATNRDQLQDANVAEPHWVHDDGTPARLPRPEVSDESSVGAAGAVWTNVPDMLLWTKAMLDGITIPEPSPNKEGPTLHEIPMIVSCKIPNADATIEEHSYAFGWHRTTIPTTQLGTVNNEQSENIIGRDSTQRQVFYHNGQITGYLASVYLFPETRSAVFTLGNAEGLGSGADWTAHAVTQALFDLEPKVDICKAAKDMRDQKLRDYDELVAEYNRNRETGTVRPDRSGFLGSFVNDGLKLTVEVKESDSNNMVMLLNHEESQRHTLTHYHHDTFGFLPRSRDDMQSRCLVDYNVYEQFLLHFHRTREGRVESLGWKMQDRVDAVLFIRQ